MAPIKFEERLKDKLDKRSLSPSADGWSKLAQRLDEEENKFKKPIYWWLSIAAGFAIMLAVSIQFFNKNESEKIINGVVEEKVLDKPLDIKTPKGDSQKPIELALEEDVLDSEKEDSVEQSKIMDYKTVIPKKASTKLQLVKNDKSSPLSIKVVEDVNVIKPQEIDNDIILKNAVATTLKELKAENELRIDKEVDSLLKVASKELFNNDLKKSTIKTVDANALLISVEEDMGQSFRSKVFEALEGSYKTLKTRVVDRKN